MNTKLTKIKQTQLSNLQNRLQGAASMHKLRRLCVWLLCFPFCALSKCDKEKTLISTQPAVNCDKVIQSSSSKIALDKEKRKDLKKEKACNPIPNEKKKILLKAVENGTEETVKSILEAYDDAIDVTDEYNNTLLAIATYYKKRKSANLIIDKMLQKKGSIDFKVGIGRNLYLIRAIQKGYKEIVQKLLNANAPLGETDPDKDCNALHWAIFKLGKHEESEEIFNLILAKADKNTLNAKDKEGYTPLALAKWLKKDIRKKKWLLLDRWKIANKEIGIYENVIKQLENRLGNKLY